MKPEKLKWARARLGYSQTKMAEELNTPASTYRNWEQGRYAPPPVLKVAVDLLVKHKS